MRVRYTSVALGELADIFNYIVDENPEGAQNVARAIEHTIAVVALMPNLGRDVAERPDRKCISAGTFPYRIVYRVVGKELEVLAIIHTAREII